MKSGDLLAHLREKHADLATFRHPVVVGFSGGPDSVALAHLLWRARQQSDPDNCKPLIIAHFNHRLRGSDSDADETFAQEWANQYNCPAAMGHYSPDNATLPDDTSPKPASENTLRETRYKFLYDVSKRFGARYLAVGHHRDDQVETMLFRLFRGTSLLGLAGIPEVRCFESPVTLIRPMLPHSRSQILDYLTAQNLDFRVDQSNVEIVYSRNWLRNVLMPQLDEHWGTDVRSQLILLSQQVQEHLELLDQITDKLKETAVSEFQGRIEIDLAAVSSQPIALVRHLLTRIWQEQRWPMGAMTYIHWNELAKKLDPHTGLYLGQRWQAPGKIELQRISSTTSELKNLALRGI